MKVCIIGAGIIGTSTAVQTKRAFPDAKITIFSEAFSPSTTSDGAAGLWLPFLDPYTPKDLVNRWSGKTFKLCEDLWRQNFSSDDLTDFAELRKAVLLLPAYELFDYEEKFAEVSSTDAPGWTKIVYNHQHVSREESERMGFPKNSFGSSFMTYIFEGSRIMPVFYDWLKRQPDVEIQQKRINQFEELTGYDVVINCTGIGAKDLTGDDAVRPVSGHVVRVKAPWLTSILAYTKNKTPTFIIPNRETVVLGVINKFDSWSTEAEPEEVEAIVDKCAKLLCPAVKDAEVVDDWIGLRPLRVGGVRLELETMTLKDGQEIKVIHNYGHGGSGLTLFWGCAEDVVKILQKEF